MLDQLGTQLVSETGRNDPGLLMTPAQMNVGQRWRADYHYIPHASGSEVSRLRLDIRVRGTEELALPVGRLTCFFVAAEGEVVRATASESRRWEIWVDAASMWAVRYLHRWQSSGWSTSSGGYSTTLRSWHRVPR